MTCYAKNPFFPLAESGMGKRQIAKEDFTDDLGKRRNTAQS